MWSVLSAEVNHGPLLRHVICKNGKSNELRFARLSRMLCSRQSVYFIHNTRANKMTYKFSHMIHRLGNTEATRTRSITVEVLHQVGVHGEPHANSSSSNQGFNTTIFFKTVEQFQDYVNECRAVLDEWLVESMENSTMKHNSFTASNVDGIISRECNGCHASYESGDFHTVDKWATDHGVEKNDE